MAWELGNPFDLTGKVALVTGGGRGIGSGFARAIANAGADVVLAARSKEQLESVADDIRALGRRVVVAPTDVSDLDQVRSLMQLPTEELGRFDIFFNNAGTNRRLPIAEATPDDWDAVHDVNLRAAFFAMKYAIGPMLSGGYGRIINTASLTSFIGMTGNSMYGASKGGVAQMTKAIATELAETPIRVNAIAPGYIRTAMTEARYHQDEFSSWVLSRVPMRRWGEPADLGGTAVFLSSPASEYVTGHVIPVDGGWMGA